jgi:hypothetical protein
MPMITRFSSKTRARLATKFAKSVNMSSVSTQFSPPQNQEVCELMSPVVRASDYILGSIPASSNTMEAVEAVL